MNRKQVAGVREDRPELPGANQGQILLKELYPLSGQEILHHILDQEKAQELVRAMPYEDFFWLIKKIGEDDCLPVLELASTGQWEYLLDLEIWERDSLDIEAYVSWLKRFEEADGKRLVEWLFEEGEFLASFHFSKSLEVIVVSDKDEVYDLPEGFFSLDGTLHIRARNPDHRETLENLIRTMANVSFERYRALILGLAGVLPAETEEEMYRLRNVRLAEHGFLPREEAISIYAPLDPEALGIKDESPRETVVLEEESRALVPILPLDLAAGKNRFVQTVLGLSDLVLLDRIRLEFAGLCNQLLSADGLLLRELDILLKTCEKASGYLSLALERLSGEDMTKAEETLRHHSLLSLFRVGVGLTMKLKWEAERWIGGSWFLSSELDVDFWGEYWGGVLRGLLKKRPMYYAAYHEGEEYRDFRSLSEVGECAAALRRLMALDSLLERLSVLFPPKEGGIALSPERTFRPLIFNLWSRSVLGLEPSLSGLSLEQARDLFQRLRDEESGPPYRMSRFKETFLADLTAYTSDVEPEILGLVRETLALIWHDFEKAHQGVSLKDLDARFSTFLTISPVSSQR
ncbi:MAG: DUF6178 family protein [Desulfatiglandales bacterium]